MSDACDQKLRSGGVRPGALALVVAVIVVGVVLWLWLYRPAQAPIPPLASAATEARAPSAGSGGDRAAPAGQADALPGSAGPAAGRPPAESPAAPAVDGEDAISNPAARAAYREAVSARSRRQGEAALESFEKAVALEPDNPALLAAAGRQAQRLGRLEEGRGLYERLLAVEEQKVGMDHPRVASVLSRLAGLYAEDGRYSEAEDLYLRALAIEEEAYDSPHPHVARELINLGRLAVAQGDLEKAQPYYERAYAIEGEAVTRDLIRSAAERHARGHPEEARSILLFGIEQSRERFGTENEGTVLLTDQLALLERSVGAR